MLLSPYTSPKMSSINTIKFLAILWQAHTLIILRLNREGDNLPWDINCVYSIDPYVIETCFYYNHLSKTQRVLTLGQTSISSHNETASKTNKEGFLPSHCDCLYGLKRKGDRCSCKKNENPHRYGLILKAYLRISIINFSKRHWEISSRSNGLVTPVLGWRIFTIYRVSFQKFSIGIS